MALAKRADIFMVAPASANVIGKMANGIAGENPAGTLLAVIAEANFAASEYGKTVHSGLW